MSNKLSFNQLQGFLLANAEEIIARTARADFLSPDEIGGSAQFGFPSTVIKKAVNKEDGSSDTISALANAFSTVDSIDYVTDIPDEVRVQLRPTYKIYKTLVFDQGRRINLELKSSITGESTIQNPGVVLKNIEISNLGGNLEEINTNIEVTVVLYATKLDHFFEKQYPAAIKNGSFSTPPEAQKIINQGISWVDLLKLNLQDLDLSQIEENMRQTNLVNRETRRQVLSEIPLPYVNKEAEQRIRLEISYGDIQDIEGYSQQQIQYMRNLVASQKEILELSLTANEVNFNEDGTAELVIQFRGSHGTDTLDRTTDLLYDPFIEDLSLQLQDEIGILERLRGQSALRSQDVEPVRRLIRSHKTFDFFGDETGFDRGQFELLVTGQIQTLTEAGTTDFFGTELIDEYISQRQIAKEFLQNYQAGLLIRGLYGPTLFFADIYDSENARLAPEDIRRVPVADRKSRVYTFNPRIQDVKNFNSNSEYKGPFNSADQFLLLAEVASRGTAETASYAEEYGGRVQDRAQGNTEEVAPFGNSSLTEIDFVYFGDIVEVALEVLASNNRFGSEKQSFEEKLSTQSPQIVKNTILRVGAEQPVTDYHKSYVRPFYSIFGGGTGQINNSVAAVSFLTEQGEELFSAEIQEEREKIDQVKKQNERRIQEIYETVGEILVSEIDFQSPQNPANTIKINIADVPICVEKFSEWFNEKVNARKRSTLFLRDYLNQLMLFLRDVLAERYSQNVIADVEPPEPLINRLFVQSSEYDFFSSVVNNNKQRPNFAFAPNAVDISDIRNLTRKISKNSKLFAKPLTIISQSPSVSLPDRNNRNRRQIDRTNNIPHIVFGDASNGILQQINFSKIDMPGVREARLLEGSRLYYGQDFQGPNILSERYNATLELVGTTFFRPTSLFYLDPRPLELGYAKNVASPARLLGLGGYYVVIRVVQNLNFAGSATWTTTVETVWESFGEESGVGDSATFLSDLNITSFNGRLALATDTEKEELPIIERPEAATATKRRQTRSVSEEAVQKADEINRALGAGTYNASTGFR
jgi:hypothetical protein